MAAFLVAYAYALLSSVYADGTNGDPCAAHEYPCATTADCCAFWHAQFPGTHCQAECTQDAAGQCSYCYLSSPSTQTPSGCPPHEFPCDTTNDCCAYWEAHFPGIPCEAECTQDEAGGCNYCYLTGTVPPSTTTTTTHVPTGGSNSGSGCTQHEYPCQTTDDCCSYWWTQHPGTECPAKCTQDATSQCNYCYVPSSSTSTSTFTPTKTSTNSATGSGLKSTPGCSQHEYPCHTTADCCSYWHAHHPGTVCQAKCTQNAVGECNYCYLPKSGDSASSTSVPLNPRPKKRKRKKASQSGTGCPQHDYPCNTTVDCCAYWDAHFPGTACGAECTTDAAGGCNYCYLTDESNTGSNGGCPPHDYPCDTTDECCKYWDAHWPGTECQAECTVDAAGGCNYCYLTSSSTPYPIPFGEEGELNVMETATSSGWLLHWKMSAVASLAVVLMTAAVISAFFVGSNKLCCRLVAKEKLLLQPRTAYGSV